MIRDRIRLCLIEDDEIMGDALLERFQDDDFDCVWCRSGKDALAALQRRRFDVVLSDIRLGDVDGEELFNQSQQLLDSVPPFVFMTGYGAIDQAVRLLKLGASDYVTKPLDIDAVVKRLRELGGRQIEIAESECSLGVSDTMRHIEHVLLKGLAASEGSVLITGESGVGKELVARRLHELASAGAVRPFVSVNCAAIPAALIEPELFGHQVLSGGNDERRGLFERADGGTLYLDEVGDLPPAMQAKLLPAIRDGAVTRMSGGVLVPVKVRVICATHQPLSELVAAGCFREDLCDHISIVHLHVPSLRERRDDILWLARLFKDRQAQKDGRQYNFTASAERALLSHPWPGNVRELRHRIERGCILANGPKITAECLFDEPSPHLPTDDVNNDPLFAHLAMCERRYIEQVLAQHGWQLGRSAHALGISRKNLWEKMRKHSISEPKR